MQTNILPPGSPNEQGVHTTYGRDFVAGDEYSRSMMEVPLLEQVWRAIWENKWFVLGIIAASLLVGVIVTVLATPLYTATSLVEISRQQANVAGVDTLEESDMSRDQEFYDTQYSLLAARSLAERVARDENLVTDEDFFAEFDADVDAVAQEGSRASRQDTRSRGERMGLAVDILLDNVTISPVRGSSLVNVSFTSPNPATSARIANSWVQQFIEATLARRFSSTEDARDFLEERLEEYRQRLEDSERRLVGYATDQGIVSLDEQQDAQGNTQTRRTLAASNLEAMNAALGEARAERIAAQSELAQANGAQQTLNNTAINGLRQRRAEVAAERARLLATFEPGYPQVEALTSQLAELDRSIATEESRVRNSGQRAYNAALQRERQLEAEVAQLRGALTGQNQASIQYNILQREVDTNRELYNALLQRYKEIGVAGVSANNIAIVDQADVPQNPSSPSLPLNLVLALLAGMVLSGGFVFARTQIDQTLRDPADVRRLLGLAQLGTIPAMDPDELMDDLEDPKSVASEAYQSASTNLSFLTEHGTPRSLLLTSTQPNEGKTTSSYALANVLARTGKKVLLVDADMRNPSLHKMFETHNETGFSTYLSGNDDIAGLLRGTKRGNLSLLTAGPIPPNPAELLASDRVGEFLQRAGEEFDHIMIDGPPVLGIADVPILASRVEGVVFALEANRTKLRSFQSVLARLHNANVFGVLVTKVDQRNAAFGYGYGYGYGYKYGSNEG